MTVPRAPRPTTRLRITFETDAVFGDKTEEQALAEVRRAYQTWLPRARGLDVVIVRPCSQCEYPSGITPREEHR